MLRQVVKVNRIFGCSYKVKEGEYLTLYQYDMNDGYGHELNMPDKTSIGLKDKDLNLKCIGNDVHILFNVNPAISENTLIVSDSDYVRIKGTGNNYEFGIIKMFNFTDWKSSKDGVMSLQKHMADTNGLAKTDQRCFNLSSKIETYNTARQSGQILLFMMAFVIVLFCISADIIIHFKVKSEMEDEQKMFCGLFRIGITDKEGMRIVYNKNICYFLMPMLIGCFMGLFYNYAISSTYGYGMAGVICSLGISMLLLVIQFIMIKLYSRNELSIMSV
jgi:putative ABC transport system permease protein